MEQRKFKLTKGTVSVIRTTKEGVQEALASGYAMDGEVTEENGVYRVINPAPIFEAEEGKTAEMSGKVDVCIACHLQTADDDFVFSQKVLEETE